MVDDEGLDLKVSLAIINEFNYFIIIIINDFPSRILTRAKDRVVH